MERSTLPGVCNAKLNLELPHLNILSKVDLVDDKVTLEPYLTPDLHFLRRKLDASMDMRHHKLNNMMSSLLDEYSLVNFHPLDLTDENSLLNVLYAIDSCLQYGEDADVKTSRETSSVVVSFDNHSALLSRSS